MDWAPGDLALCIKMGEWRSYNSEETPDAFPRPGGVYTVSQVQFMSLYNATCLHFEEVPPSLNFLGDPIPFAASRFRKIIPREADAFDREVIEALTGEPVHTHHHDAAHNACHGEVLGCADFGQFPINREGEK